MSDVPIRLLRDALQSRVPAAPSQECLDAETVAAWADDALGRDERQAAEAHAADCARCQAVLAAMAATMPQAAPRSWWRLPAMRWLVPLTVATAALLVWVNVPSQELAPAPATVLRQAQAGTAPESSGRRGECATTSELSGGGEARCGRESQERDERDVRQGRGIGGRPEQGREPRRAGEGACRISQRARCDASSDGSPAARPSSQRRSAPPPNRRRRRPRPPWPCSVQWQGPLP